MQMQFLFFCESQLKPFLETFHTVPLKRAHLEKNSLLVEPASLDPVLLDMFQDLLRLQSLANAGYF